MYAVVMVMRHVGGPQILGSGLVLDEPDPREREVAWYASRRVPYPPPLS
jgi:hypothetical protein